MAYAVGEDRSDFQAAGRPWGANDFGFTKFTESDNWKSKTAAANWANMKAEGVARGGYHFLHPAVSGVAQANFFINYVKACGGWQDGDMFACDAEIAVGADGLEVIEPHRAHRAQAQLLRLPAHRMDASVGSTALAFCNRVAQLVGPKCKVELYTYLGFRANVADCVKYPLWIADYAGSPPASVSPWRSWAMWQNSDRGGQGGGDTNRFNGNRAALLSWLGSGTGWTETLVNDLPTLGQGAKDKTGAPLRVHRIQSWCNDISDWNGLGAHVAVTGTFDAATTAIVKRVQLFFGFTGKDVDGVVGPDTWGKLIGA